MVPIHPPHPEPTGRRELAGKIAAVTGSTSGIGRATAERLAQAGADVVVHGRSSERAAETARLVRAAGSEVRIILADVSQDEARRRLVEEAWQWRDRIDIWINNAGVDVLTGGATQWEFLEKLRRLWQVDVEATIAISRDVGRRMTASHSDAHPGVILNMGWDQAEVGMEGDAGEMFAATKGAVMGFSRSLARSLAPRVRVNCLAPGWIRTAWGDAADDYWQRRAVAESLRRRWGAPDDVARIACFLASPAADFLNGQVIPINGGWGTSERPS